MTDRREITLDGRSIGPAQRPYIIAELSANHLGKIDRALETIRVAKECGADAIKLQTYTADTLTLDLDAPDFQITSGLWAGRTLHDLYREAYTPWDWFPRLFEYARSIGITIFSSPFDRTAVDLLSGLNAPAYKIASFECVDIDLIAYTARQGKPVIISTGMANVEEIGDALETAKAHGTGEIVLLHCVSGYPTPVAESNLRTIGDMAKAFDCLIGLSDHTPGTAVPCAAVALGAVLIEKHFTLSRADGGADSEFSLEPDELKRLVNETAAAHQSLGAVNYSLKGSEAASIKFRRSLYAVADISAGEVLTAENVRSIRPGYGLKPKELPNLLGRHARVDIPKGTALDWKLIA